jgi:hypothetical protein
MKPFDLTRSLLSALTTLVLCAAPSYAETTVKIVSSLPKTGSANAQATSIANGILPSKRPTLTRRFKTPQS